MLEAAPNINEPIIKAYIESIRSEDPQIRKELDYTYSFDGNETIMYMVRPVHFEPKKSLKLEFAKIKYNGAKKEWNLYWMRASGKWEPDGPMPKAKDLETIIDALKGDVHGCFHV